MTTAAFEYTTVPLSGEALPFNLDDGGNHDAIKKFSGPNFVERVGDRIWVRTAEGPIELHPGWLVAREAGQFTVYAPAPFRWHVPSSPVS